MPATLDTTVTKDRVVISFPPDALPDTEREDFIAFMKMEWTLRQSRLSETDASTLAEEVNSGWWQRNRERILSKIGGS